MKLPRRQFLHLAAGAAALITLTNTPLAQDWPIRPVTMVYPFAAGSAADVLGRLFGSRLSSFWARRWSSRMLAAQAA
jgi:tripartite-type tricarboxylate transporter receptor subunit TctC